MSCQGHTVGGKFSELRTIIDRVKDKSRVGVCLDTCHAFAAGYDIKSDDGYERTMAEFEEIIGFKYLKALHLNDSRGKLGCNLDRHENIGRGCIGLDGFKRVMNDVRFNSIPMILETPANLDDSKEIEILYSLCN